ncbi:hypothetical protein NST84_10110 [Paenibacillus sp. FSL R7-0345]
MLLHITIKLAVGPFEHKLFKRTAAGFLLDLAQYRDEWREPANELNPNDN